MKVPSRMSLARDLNYFTENEKQFFINSLLRPIHFQRCVHKFKFQTPTNVNGNTTNYYVSL